MIYTHWYFCHAVKLSPADAAAFLDTLYTLENPLPADRKVSALKQLGQLDRLHRVYALPVLVELLVSDRLREQMEKDPAPTAELRDLCKQTILGAFAESGAAAGSAGQRCPLQSVIHKLDRISLDSLPSLVLDSVKRYGLHRSETIHSYLETDEFGNEVLWLSLLRAVGRSDPRLIAELDFSELLDPALEQNCGELPFQLALEVYSFSQQHFQELQRCFPSDWVVRPYCVQLALKHLICVEKRIEPGYNEADSLFWEATQLKYFDIYYERCLPKLKSVWMDEKLDSRGRRQICATLWQCVAWDLAFEMFPKQCIPKFTGLWSVPRFGKSPIEVACTLTQRYLMEGAGATATGNDNHQLSHGLCSPWQYEGNGSAAEQGSPFAAFPYLSHPFVALRGFSGAVMLHKIFTHIPNVRRWGRSVTFYRLLLNLGSAFECQGARQAREGTASAEIWSRPLQGLSVFAWQCITDIGTGSVSPHAPGNLVEILRTPREVTGRHLQKLIGERGLFVCAHWAALSLRRGRHSPKKGKNRWLAERSDKSSCAQLLCEMLFAAHPQLARDSEDVLELLYQKYSFLIGDLELDDHCWADRYQFQPEMFGEEEDPVSVSMLVLSRPIELTEWENLPLLRKDCFTAEAWPLVQTLRLQAVVRTPRTEQNEKDAEQWSREWRDAIVGLQAADLKRQRLLLYTLCQLLCPTGGEGAPVILANRIFLTAIDTVYSVIDAESMFYAECISRYLSQSTPSFPFTESTLAQAQKANMLKLMELAKTDRGFQWLLDRFVAGCAAGWQKESAYSVRRQMKSYWQEQCVTQSSMRKTTIAGDEWNPLTDRFLLPSGEKWNVARSIQDPTKSFWNEPVTDGFRDSVDQTGQQQRLLGIVMGRPDGRDKCYFVNCGTGAPVIANSYLPQPFRNGQVVILKFNKGEYTIQTPAWTPGSPEETIQVEISELVCNPFRAFATMVLPNGQEISIPDPKADSGREEMRLSALLDLWCPDTSLFFEDEFSAFPKKQKYEAVYDADLGAYVPIRRSFLRLLLERILVPGNPERAVSLIFIQNSRNEKGTWMLFSAAPGVNYMLSEEDWLPESLDKLLENLTPGLEVNAAAVLKKDGRFRLSLNESQPWDDRNLRLAALFQPGESFYLEYDGKANKRFTVRKLGNAEIRVQGKLMPKEGEQRTGINRRGSNVQVTENGWDIMQQRRQQVLCEPMEGYYLSPQSRRPEVVQQLIDLAPGTCFRMRCLLGKNALNGYYFVALENGMRVYCAAESLSMLGVPADTLVKDRLCILEYSCSQENNDRSENVKGICIPGADPQSTMLKGVVSRIPPVVKGSPNDKLHQTVWLLQGKQLLECSVPGSAFLLRPHSLGAVVTARRQEDGMWTFSAVDRTINFRALWQLENHIQDEAEEVQGIPLGRDVQVPGYGNCMVSQDTRQPVLHIWPNDKDIPDEPLCGLSSGSSPVMQHFRRRSDYGAFPYARRTDLVYANQDGVRWWGESGSGEFGRISRTWSVECVIEVPRKNQIPDQYDLRRVFHCESSKTEPEPDRRDKFMQSVVDDYQEWLAETAFPLHITGAIRDGKLEMKGLRVPAQCDRDTKSDMWLGTIPFLPDGARAWVAPNPNMPYDPYKVRAALTREDNVWYASCRDAEPFRVDDTLRAEFRVNSGENIHRRLYYAGPEDDGRLRFEWGYGYCLLVGQEDIVDTYGNSVGALLFYGDRIEQFQLIRGKGEFGWQICVAVEQIKPETARKIALEARKNVLQLVKIHIDRRTDTVEITHASLVEYDAGSRRTVDGWALQPFRNGTLDQNSIDKLLNENALQEEERTILACLDLNRDESRSRGLLFFYISLEDIDENPRLIAGKTVCMVAGRICCSHPNSSPQIREGKFVFTLPSNDYLLHFYFPDGLEQEENAQEDAKPQFTVSVIRRSFSLDESKLRVLYESNRKDEYYRKRMLVRLTEPMRNRKNEWKGSVLGTWFRQKDLLAEWLENKPNRLVVLDRHNKDDNFVRMEVMPGILYMLEREKIEGAIHRGAIARLKKDENGSLRAEVVLPSDDRYIPSQGRPVELLPMDGIIRRCYEWDSKRAGTTDGQPTLQQVIAAEGKHFTVAGFPQILLYHPEALERMLSIAPPRLGYLIPDTHSPHSSEYTLGNAPFTAAKLVIDPATHQPRLHYIYPEDEERETDWGQLSFLDGSAKQIASFAERGRWHYHDRETAMRTAPHRWQKRSLPNGEQYSTMVFFPNSEGALRVPPHELFRYGYSAQEITECGLPAEQGAYPVAHATQNSLWVELLPGRIVELPKKYLYNCTGKDPLSNLYSNEFHAGDMVWLQEGNGVPGGQRSIMLSNCRFGARAFFSARRNFLPVLGEGPEGSIRLGCAYRELIYPAADAARWTKESIVYVDGSNRLGALDEERPFLQGDTVMIMLNDKGNLAVCGYTKQLYVSLAEDSVWKNAKWLRDLLRNYQDRRNLLTSMPMPLTVLVQRCQWEGDTPSIAVAVQQENMDDLPAGTVLCAICLCLLGRPNDRKLLLQAGNTILALDPEQVLPKVPTQDIPHIVKALAQAGQSLWLHKEEDGWHAGLKRWDRSGTCEVRLLLPVEQANGILCCTVKEQELRWLPGKNASRSREAAIASLWEALASRTTRSARIVENGHLSLIDTDESLQKFTMLQYAPVKYRAIPRVLLKTMENGTYQYLAELYPLGDLVTLNSEESCTADSGEGANPIPVEISGKPGKWVYLTPLGAGRVNQRLPRWINTSLGTSWEQTGKNTLSSLPREYSAYANARKNGTLDAAHDTINIDFLRSGSEEDRDTEINEKLCYLCALLQKEGTDRGLSQEKRDTAMRFAEEQLGKWLMGQGGFLASGFHANLLKDKRSKWYVDLLPALSGILLLSWLKSPRRPGLETVAKELSVHLSRMLGLACDSSVHIEVLLREWLWQKERPGFWKWLSALSLGGVKLTGEPDKRYSSHLSMDQCRILKKICTDIRHLSLTEDNSELRLTADCLLYSIGELDDFRSFSKSLDMGRRTYVMNQLAVLGHMLTPPAARDHAAVPRLPEDIVMELNGIRASLRLPLCVLTDKPLPLSAGERNAIILCREDYARILRTE